jgi:hypothetical protein
LHIVSSAHIRTIYGVSLGDNFGYFKENVSLSQERMEAGLLSVVVFKHGLEIL